jgi:TPR repeat protein
MLYEDGRGVPRDEREAMKWYQQAAEQEDGNSYLNLARLSARAGDYGTAYYWALLAQRSSWLITDPPSQKCLDLLRSHLAPDQVAGVERRVNDWIKQHPASPAVWEASGLQSLSRRLLR